MGITAGRNIAVAGDQGIYAGRKIDAPGVRVAEGACIAPPKKAGLRSATGEGADGPKHHRDQWRGFNDGASDGYRSGGRLQNQASRRTASATPRLNYTRRWRFDAEGAGTGQRSRGHRQRRLHQPRSSSLTLRHHGAYEIGRCGRPMANWAAGSNPRQKAAPWRTRVGREGLSFKFRESVDRGGTATNKRKARLVVALVPRYTPERAQEISGAGCSRQLNGDLTHLLTPAWAGWPTTGY